MTKMTNQEAKEIVQTFREAMDHPETQYKDILLGALDMAIEALDRPEDRWIPVNERLPNKEGYYLVDCKERVLSIQRFNFSIADHKPYWSGMRTVYAWKPLPEPYKESEAENDNNT